MKSIFSAAAVVACVLYPTMASAASEPRKTETGLPERWATPTVSIVLDPSLEDLGAGTTDAVRQAIGTWLADVPGLPAVVFEDGTERTSSAHDGKSVILAAPITLAGHEKDLALTTTYASDETGDILEADIVFNTRYAFAPMASPSAACSNVFDVGSVATHESGHFFGLDEDWDDHATTMYVITGSCDSHKRVLTTEDTAAIRELYAPPTTLTAQCDAAPAKPGGTAGLLLFALGLAARTIRRDEPRRRARARADR